MSSDIPVTLDAILDKYQSLIERRLREILEGNPNWPLGPVSRDVMLHAVFAGGGGKRLRPGLVLLSAEWHGTPLDEVIDAAAGVELIHCYTLVIDDIQDGDELRRGEPAAYIKFGLNDALLGAGRLLTEGLSRVQSGTALDPELVRYFLHFLHSGQEADLASESWPAELRTDGALDFIFRGKTGALFELCMLLGLGKHGVTPAAMSALRQIGSDLGFVFQATDDLLELTSTAEMLGKPVKKDRGKKLLYVSTPADMARKTEELDIFCADLERRIRDYRSIGSDVLAGVVQDFRHRIR